MLLQKDYVIKKFDPLKNSQVADQAIIYDHDGHLLKQEGGYELLKKLKFWEHYEGNYPQCSLLENPPSEFKEILQIQFLEAALTRVVILDERIQSAMIDHEPLKKGDHELKMFEVLERMNIFVPFQNVNLYDPNQYQITSWLVDSDEKRREFEFLVVHQGILNRLKDRLDEEKSPRDWITEIASQCRACLVICSGRGKPLDIPDKARFIPISSLLHWTIAHPSKYHLCHLLYSSRRPSHA